MKLQKLILPLFLIIISLIIIIPTQIQKAHATAPSFVGTQTFTGTTVAVTGNFAGDFIGMVVQPSSNSAVNTGVTISDSMGNTWTQLYNQPSGSCIGFGTSSSGCAMFTQTKTSGTDTITVSISGCGCNPEGIIDHFTNVLSTISPTSREPCNNVTPCNGNAPFTDTYSPAVTTANSNQILWETATVLGVSATGASSITANSNQNSINNIGAFSNALKSSTFYQISCSSSCPSVSVTVDSTAASKDFDHGTVVLAGTSPSNTGSVTQCYGACGKPAQSFTNPNATHQINFNQSYTIFYTFQSNLNGFIQNVTVDVGRSYSNGMQVALGAWTASCASGTSPFTTSCAGQLQPGFLISNPNIGKGKFSIATNIAVVSGQWIAIGVFGLYSGLDLNETNSNGCGATNDAGICANPPGMMYTRGTIPQTISTSSACTSNNSPCNFAGISQTALYAFINGNVVAGNPVPPPTAGCTNSDLSCFMIASACGLTPSNCTLGGTFLLGAYFLFFTLATLLGVSYVNREYEQQIQIPGSIFFFYFIILLFAWAAMGLLPAYVVIVIFIFTGLGVAGYFGSAFLGRSNRND